MKKNKSTVFQARFSYREFLAPLHTLLNIALQLARHGQIADSLGDLLVVGLQIVVDVAELLHDARDVAHAPHGRVPSLEQLETLARVFAVDVVVTLEERSKAEDSSSFLC